MESQHRNAGDIQCITQRVGLLQSQDIESQRFNLVNARIGVARAQNLNILSGCESIRNPATRRACDRIRHSLPAISKGDIGRAAHGGVHRQAAGDGAFHTGAGHNGAGENRLSGQSQRAAGQ